MRSCSSEAVMRMGSSLRGLRVSMLKCFPSMMRSSSRPMTCRRILRSHQLKSCVLRSGSETRVQRARRRRQLMPRIPRRVTATVRCRILIYYEAVRRAAIGTVADYLVGLTNTAFDDSRGFCHRSGSGGTSKPVCFGGVSRAGRGTC